MSSSEDWRVITPRLLEALPEGPGVFEIGNLVRTVLLVGAAELGLRSGVRAALTSPALQSRAHCIRFELAEDPGRRASERLDDYRRAHHGMPPLAHRTDPVARLVAPSRASRTPRITPRRPDEAPATSFLRASPAA